MEIKCGTNTLVRSFICEKPCSNTVRAIFLVTNWRNFPEKDSEKDVKNYITSVLKERRTKLIKEHMETRKAEQVIKEQEEGSPEKRRKRKRAGDIAF